MIERLTTGTYLVDAPCPRCGALEEIVVQLRSVLTTPEEEIGSLKVRLKAKAREHDCQQRRIPDTTITFEQQA